MEEGEIIVMIKAIKDFLKKIHNVSGIEEFWSQWKRTKYCYTSQNPIFNGNKIKKKEENLQILANQFIKQTGNIYHEKKTKINKKVSETTGLLYKTES